MRHDLLSSLADVDDRELLARTKRLAQREREATAYLVASLAEIDARRLFLGQGCASLFTYCTQILGLSEDAAYSRIEVARAARKYPVILELLEKGEVHPTAVRLLAPHFTPKNHRELLARARHQTRRTIEELVARLRPQADVPTVVRRLPEPAPRLVLGRSPEPGTPAATEAVAATPAIVSGPAAQPPPRAAVVAPLSPGRYLVQFTGDAELDGLLRRAHDLLGIPRRDAALVVKRALALLVKDLERKRLGATERPRIQKQEPKAGSRHIPNAVKREVSERDGEQCAFVGEDGRRCTETFDLQFAHRKAYAKGGKATRSNIEKLCPAHNGYEAVQEFGRGGPEGWSFREPMAHYGPAPSPAPELLRLGLGQVEQWSSPVTAFDFSWQAVSRRKV